MLGTQVIFTQPSNEEHTIPRLQMQKLWLRELSDLFRFSQLVDGRSGIEAQAWLVLPGHSITALIGGVFLFTCIFYAQCTLLLKYTEKGKKPESCLV